MLATTKGGLYQNSMQKYWTTKRAGKETPPGTSRYAAHGAGAGVGQDDDMAMRYLAD